MYIQKNPKNRYLSKKSKLMAFTFALLMILAALVPVAFCHDPPLTLTTYAYVAASPNPVGVNQQVFIVMWIDKVPPTAGGIGGDRWTDYTVEITKPDGTTETLGPFYSDSTSSAYTLYTPDQIGTYNLFFNYPGQTLSLYNPTNGVPGLPSDSVGDIYLGSSATATLTVQQEQIQPVEDYPLPTGYWTRPIDGANSQWACIASNYLGSPQIYNGAVQPDGSAPNSAHVMWAKPLQDGGVVGGSNTGVFGATYYTGLSYEGKFTNPIIMYGRLYYPLPRSNDPTGNGYACVDLRTGEEIFIKNATKPWYGQLYWYDSMNQHGVISNGYLWTSEGTTWSAYDPSNGNWLFNETNVPANVATSPLVGTLGGKIVYGPDGSIDIYQLNVAGKWMAMWNNTAALELAGELGTGTGAYQWRPVGKVVDASNAYSWNVTIPELPPGSNIWYVIPDDLVLGSTQTFGGMMGTTGAIWALSLKPETKGQLLWMTDYVQPAGDLTRSMGPVDTVNRVFTMMDKETMQWIGFNLDTGARLWGPVGDPAAWNYYGSPGFSPSGQLGYTAYGRLYTAGYGGVLYCYDTNNGNLLWTYGNGGEGNSTNSGLDTPYGNYPLFMGAIADGKVYCYTGEHSPNSPLYKGVKVRCIDAYTGTEKWTIQSWGGVGAFGQMNWPVADGYLIYLNNYDGRIYCIGKGPSATTVEAPMSGAAAGSVITIRGTVIDQSAGAQGTPCISDSDMGVWMEYLYMQKPMPNTVTGVPVTLTAVGSDGTRYPIGTAVSDMGGSFGISWTPPSAGTYEIIANFTGTESYGGSYATTFVAVGSVGAMPSISAPTLAPTMASPSVAPNPQSGMGTEIYIVISAVVVIVAVAVAAVLLRRRK
jgi:outer membrane protein assembly factor BamB